MKDPDTGSTRTIVDTVAGTGKPGFAGDGGRGALAQFNQPHALQFFAGGRFLYVCDIGNHRIRRLRLDTGIIETYAGTGVAGPTPDGAPLAGTPLNGPRTLVQAPNGDLFVALRGRPARDAQRGPWRAHGKGGAKAASRGYSACKDQALLMPRFCLRGSCRSWLTARPRP